MLDALRKAYTGTLFGAGDVFAATDGLLLVYSHTRACCKTQPQSWLSAGVLHHTACRSEQQSSYSTYTTYRTRVLKQSSHGYLYHV